MARHVVAEAGEIPPGGRKLVTLAGREIGVFNVNGAYHAILNRCPHAGGALCKGRIMPLIEADEPGHYRVTRRGELLRCPWHGWEFDLCTGQSWCDPATMQVKSYPVSVEPGARLAKGPYVAETFPVSVEHDYVVVEA